MATLFNSCQLLPSRARAIHSPPWLPRALCSSASPPEWAGLQAWRTSPFDERRAWPPQPKSKETVTPIHHPVFPTILPTSLAEWGALVLNTPDPLAKASFTHHAFRLWSNGKLPLGVAKAPDRPARLPKPVLVPLKQVPDVKHSPLPRNAHVLHNLAHIELNAVDLAWDTVVRFSEANQVLGEQFFADFAHVADDESRHFCWCSQRLAELGCCYGAIPAHNVLVDEGHKSAGNVMARLAVVPMVQEARGLDSGPRLAARLVGWGDLRSAGIVNQISEEELAHVAVGVSWFLDVCKKMNKAPDSTFKELLQEFNVELKGPFNHPARAKAGLPRHWYDKTPELCTEVDIKRKCGRSTSSVLEDTEEFHNKEKDVNHVGHDDPANTIAMGSPNDCLSKVYERLTLIVAMEKDNVT